MRRGAKQVAVVLAVVMVGTVAAGVANGQQSGGGLYQQLLDALAALQRPPIPCSSRPVGISIIDTLPYKASVVRHET